MKKLFFIIITLFAVNANAQAPEKMSYQAVVRNTTNVLVTNQSVGMRISVLQGSATGTAVYVETHTATTNANGLVSLEIGGGTPVTGTFAAINWAAGLYFVKTETDQMGGTSYTIIGTSQLLSTPYALYAKTSGSSTPGMQGTMGPPGATGANGQGVPTGGTANQILTKVDATDFNTAWATTAINNWSLTGNASTLPTTNFIGTTDNQPLVFRVNNLRAGFIGTNITANSSFGLEALVAVTTGVNNVAVGFSALRGNTSGINNTAIGVNALLSNTNGNRNAAVGINSLLANVGGIDNTAIGSGALRSNTSGNNNVALGSSSLFSNTIGNGNTGIGFNALQANTTGINNVAVGSSSLFSNTIGNGNTAIGTNALQVNTAGLNNTAIGFGALVNTNGNNNTAVGINALRSNTTGSRNVALGDNALSQIISGSGNVAIGSPGTFFINLNGNNTTMIGNGADVSADNLTNATAIGFNAFVNASNKVRLGNANVTVIEGQVPFTAASDRRFKSDIQNIDKGINFIMQLKPVSYLMKNSTDSRRNWGFIAQDIQKLLGDSNAIVTVGQDDVKYLGLRYTDFVAPLVKAVQEQQAVIAALQLDNAKLRADNTAIKADNSAINVSLNKIIDILGAQGLDTAELKVNK